MRARVLAVSMLVFQGAMAAGSAGWAALGGVGAGKRSPAFGACDRVSAGRRMTVGAFLLCVHQPSRQPREMGRAISWARLGPEGSE